ncbi:Peptidase S28 [Penicillium waksmanii]|uniref:Peptidase S28 n=1 Tax=Penicillium waksmanii TaxID=69791 RepID=UPI0025493F4B|nr:Peptidase S28 [Penicillium waksmanii]KAJ5989257.1 Peptidase S28 [Penicillium waksmanii]
MNRQFDPWRDSALAQVVHFNQRPPPLSMLFRGGFHCSDLLLKNGDANKGVQDIIDAEVAQIKTWVKEYYH